MSDQRVALETALFHHELLRFLTAKLGCREQAADVLQDTFVRFRGLPNLAAVVQPRAFLYKTALNLTVDLFRRQHIRSEGATQPAEIERMSSARPRQDCEIESQGAGAAALRCNRKPAAEMSFCSINSRGCPMRRSLGGWAFQKTWWKNMS